MDVAILHLWAALATAGVVVVLTVAAMGAAAFGRPGRLWIDRLILLGLGTLGVTAAVGLAVLVTQRPPADPLHLLYAVAAPLALVVGRYGGRGRTSRDRLWLAGGCLVAVGSTLRLFMTAA